MIIPVCQWAFVFLVASLLLNIETVNLWSIMYAGVTAGIYGTFLAVWALMASFSSFLSMHEARAPPLTRLAEWNPLRKVQGGYLAILVKSITFAVAILNSIYICSTLMASSLNEPLSISFLLLIIDFLMMQLLSRKWRRLAFTPTFLFMVVLGF